MFENNIKTAGIKQIKAKCCFKWTINLVMYVSVIWENEHWHTERDTQCVWNFSCCVWSDCLPFDTLYAAFQWQKLFISSIQSFSISLFHSHPFLFSAIQKTQRYCNFTEIWLTLAAFREARANVLWRILNLDVWSSTDCEGENSSPHLIRHRDPDPNTELIEPVNASAPYHHATKSCLDTHTLFTFRYLDHLTGKMWEQKNSSIFF